MSQVAVVVHQPFGPQAFAGLLVELEVVFVVVVPVPFQLGLVVCQQAVVAVGPLAVGSACHFHLQQAKVKAELDLVSPVVAANAACGNLARLVRPVVEDVAYVNAHMAPVGRSFGYLRPHRLPGQVYGVRSGVSLSAREGIINRNPGDMQREE